MRDVSAAPCFPGLCILYIVCVRVRVSIELSLSSARQISDMPTFPLLAEVSHFLGVFLLSHAGLMKSRFFRQFCEPSKVAHFLSPKGLFQSHNVPRRGRPGRRGPRWGDYDSPPDT